MEAFNKLTPAQVERLALLSEELGEAQQAIGKILRHGYDSYHPDFPEVSNRAHLQKEIGDVDAAASLLCKSGDLNLREIVESSDKKSVSVWKYMHHNSPDETV